MQYTINRISFDEVFSDNSPCFFEKGGRTIEGRLGDKAIFDSRWYIHLEIYNDKLDIWHASFQVDNEDSYYLANNDKLFITFSEGHKIYLYCLKQRKCIDISTSHNQYISAYSYLCCTTGVFLEHKNRLFILDDKNISAFDLHGLIWQVRSPAPYKGSINFENDDLFISTPFYENQSTYDKWHYNINDGHFIGHTKALIKW